MSSTTSPVDPWAGGVESSDFGRQESDVGVSQPHPALVELAAGRDLPFVSDVDALVRSAMEHRMAGLLWTAWSTGPKPASCWIDLTVADLRSRERQAKLWSTLTEITRRVNDLGVELATAKGVTAEARWYRRPGERPCLDIDLLVGPDDIGRAREIVAALDPGNMYLQRIDRLVRAGVVQSVDLLFDGVPVDLHFDIFKLGIGCRQQRVIWDRLVQFPLAVGVDVRVLDAEISLIHFLLHLNKDRFRYLLGFVDVARLLEQEKLDWQFIRAFAEAEGLQVPVSLSLDAVLGTMRLSPQSRQAAPGWRAGAWRIAWRESVRLQGDLGVVRYRHRQDLIALLAPGRAREALGLWCRRELFPPTVFLDVWYPNITGPYLWRLTKGRIGSNWVRLKAIPSRLRRRPERGPRPSLREIGLPHTTKPL